MNYKIVNTYVVPDADFGEDMLENMDAVVINSGSSPKQLKKKYERTDMINKTNWLIQGSGRSYQGDKAIHLEESDIVYIAPDVPHTFRPLGDKKVILVNILSPLPDR